MSRIKHVNNRHNDVFMFFSIHFKCDFPIAPIAANVEAMQFLRCGGGGWPLPRLNVSMFFRNFERRQEDWRHAGSG